MCDDSPVLVIGDPNLFALFKKSLCIRIRVALSQRVSDDMGLQSGKEYLLP